MENLQQKCKDPVDLKAVVDQKIAMKSIRVFLEEIFTGAMMFHLLLIFI